MPCQRSGCDCATTIQAAHELSNGKTREMYECSAGHTFDLGGGSSMKLQALTTSDIKTMERVAHANGWEEVVHDMRSERQTRMA